MKTIDLIRKGLAFLLVSVLLTGTLTAVPAESVSRSGAEDVKVSVRVAEDVMRTGDYLYRVMEDGTAELVEYTGMEEVREIPAEIAGYPVTAIGERCFSNQGNMHFYTDDYPAYLREYIRTVVVPEGIVSIGDYAFEDCFNLIEAILPASLRRIGEGAFSGCGSLMRTVLPGNLEELGDYAFRDCGSLTKIALPDSLRAIGANPFVGCEHLARFELSPSHPLLRYDGGMLFDRTEDKLVCVTREAWEDNAEVPEGVRIIGESAFAGTPFTGIRLPESLSAIGSYAFSECMNLLELTIPKGVETIGDNPVRGCPLQTLTLSEGQTAFSVRDSMFFDDREGRLIAFLKVAERWVGAGNVPDPDKFPKEIETEGVRMRLLYPRYDRGEPINEPAETCVVPDGTREIGAFAFYSTRLASVSLPDSLRVIGAGAFEDCENLQECSLPAQIGAIPDRLFRGCAGLTELTIPDGVASVGAFAFCGSGIEEIRLPDSVTTAGPYAFADCDKLRTVVLSEAMTKIPKGAFSRSAVEAVTLPEGITAIGAQAFAGCEGLTALDLPPQITMIPDFCFYDSRLHEAAIPSGVTYIGDHAFRMGEYTGSDLEMVSIPDSVQFIGNYAFSGSLFTGISLPAGIAALGKGIFSSCSNLHDVSLPDGLKKISEAMFAYCDLESIVIPDSVSFIGEDAFYNCARLKQVTLPAGRTEIDGNPFIGAPISVLSLAAGHPNLRRMGNLLIDAPADRVIAWLPLEEATTCVVPDGIRIIGDGAFAFAGPINALTLPDSLRVIGNTAFLYCDLKELRLPAGLEEIGDSAVGDLADATRLPEGLKKIGAYAFYGVKEARIPGSVERIGKAAFGDSVRRIEFTNGPVRLDGCPFEYCSPEIVLPEGHPTLVMADGNLYSREDRRLIVQLTDSPIRQGTLEIEEDALRGSGAAVPESVELIRMFGASWYCGYPDCVYVVPGSTAEAFFEHGLTR